MVSFAEVLRAAEDEAVAKVAAQVEADLDGFGPELIAEAEWAWTRSTGQMPMPVRVLARLSVESLHRLYYLAYLGGRFAAARCIVFVGPSGQPWVEIGQRAELDRKAAA